MEEQFDPTEEMMAFLGELQDKYSISEEDINMLIDNINTYAGLDEEVPAEEVPLAPEEVA